jgi:hypothetical protein
MKPQPAPYVPGNTEFERFDNAVRQVLSVPKEQSLKSEAPKRREPKKARRLAENSGPKRKR